MKKIAKAVNFNMIEIELLNPYYPNVPIKNFSDLDEKLNYYYDYISDYDSRPPLWPTCVTPRAHLGDFRSTSRDIFYYISWLYDNNPESVIDFGCGECFFKKWFPNIFGVEVTPWAFTRADLIIDPKQFVEENPEQFDCGMALNSIHFGNFDKVKENINKCMTLIKSKGRFLFTINIDAVIKFGNYDDISNVNTTNFYDEVIKSLNYKIILLDILDRKNIKYSPPLNGDIRFILEKD